jgi:hypothetical protein
VIFAQGALTSGSIANRIFFEGQVLTAFRMEIVGMVLLLTFLVLGPLFVFVPTLLAAKRQGLPEYGVLAASYVGQFERSGSAAARPRASR